MTQVETGALRALQPPDRRERQGITKYGLLCLQKPSFRLSRPKLGEIGPTMTTGHTAEAPPPATAPAPARKGLPPLPRKRWLWYSPLSRGSVEGLYWSLCCCKKQIVRHRNFKFPAYRSLRSAHHVPCTFPQLSLPAVRYY